MASSEKSETHPPIDVLGDLFQSLSPLRLTAGDFATYRQFRIYEPALVSFADGKPLGEGVVHDVVALFYGKEPIAVSSFVVQENSMKKEKRDKYARIDLVIGEPIYRGIGAGRAVILCTLVYLLRTFGDRLYSISSLAAHPAVQKVLEQAAFVGTERAELSYVHEELPLGEINLKEIAKKISRSTEQSLRATKFALRQRQGTS